MRHSVIIIKILLVVSIVCALISIPLSYFQDICGNWGYFWGNAIAIGIFASSFVALSSEYIHYKNQKNEIEKNLYRNIALIFVKLKTVYSEINQSHENAERELSTSFLHPQMEDINNLLIQIIFDANIYSVIRDDIVAKSIKHLRHNTSTYISNLLIDLREVEVAINEDILDVYKKNLESLHQYKNGMADNYIEQHPHITSSSQHTNDALQKVVGHLNDGLFDSLESLLLAISKRKSNNFDWKKDKERILKLV